MRFTALHNFWSDDTGSEYVAGLSYLVRDEDYKLRELVAEWIEQGLVKEGGGVAVVTGTGG